MLCLFPFTAYEVSLRIKFEFGKIRTRKNSVFGHFSRSVSHCIKLPPVVISAFSLLVIIAAAIGCLTFFVPVVLIYSWSSEKYRFYQGTVRRQSE